MAGNTDSDSGPRPRIVFFGSGPVAAASLELLNPHFEIEAVITKPQPPHHKESFPVLEMAARLGLRTLTPYGKAELSTLFATKPVSSHIGVVIDYGFIINQDVIDYFPLGIINSHFSLLPEWRGADPITFAILSGQQRTGVSLMRIVAALDEGPVLAFGVHDLAGDETTPTLTAYLVQLSAALLRESLPRYIEGTTRPVPQEEVAKALGVPFVPSYSRKLTKQDGILDFTKPAAQLEREVRAYADWPKSRTVLAGKDIVVTSAHVIADDSTSREPGTAFTVMEPEKKVGIQTAEGVLVIDRLKPAGKGEMTATAFLAGNKV